MRPIPAETGRLSAAAANRLFPVFCVSVFLAAGLSGCVADPKAAEEAAEGEANMLSQEVDDMGATSKSSMANALLKSAADTIGVQIEVEPAKWDAGCECFIRSKTLTTSGGYSRVRVDSLSFLDAAGKSLRLPAPARVKTVHHVRAITQSKAGREAQVRVVTDLVITGGTDTVGTWNGTIAGTFAGETYKSGTITNVVRKLDGKFWKFPESGTISVERPAATLTVTFSGGTSATAVRTSKLTGKSVTVTIDKTYKAEL